MISFWSSFIPRNLELMNVLSLFISFNTLFFTSILFSSLCPPSFCLLTLEYFAIFSAYVFIINMVGKNFVPTNRLTSSQVPAYEKRQYKVLKSRLDKVLKSRLSFKKIISVTSCLNVLNLWLSSKGLKSIIGRKPFRLYF